MKKLSREDIKQLVEEVIQEKWSDILLKPMLKDLGFDFSSIKRHHQIEMYDDFDNWLNEMINGSGHYIGPKIYGFDVPYDKYIIDTSDPHTSDSLEKMIEWNESVGKQNGLSMKEIYKFNSDVRRRFERDYPEAYLGSLSN